MLCSIFQFEQSSNSNGQQRKALVNHLDLVSPKKVLQENSFIIRSRWRDIKVFITNDHSPAEMLTVLTHGAI